jgi:adenylate cyclase
MRGERDRLKDWIARALLVSPDNIIMRYNFACTTALYMDDPDAALDLLEPVLAEVTESAYKAISSDPDMDSLRGDPRFKRMMEGAAKRLGIASPTPAAAT